MTIALIAGTGGLPPYLAETLVAQGRDPLICEMSGFASEVVGDFQRIGFRIETLGTFLATLKSLNVTEVCMAGAVQRPPVDPTAIDAATAPMVARLQAAMAQGDDGTLREVIAIFEEHGFALIGAHQLVPDLLPKAGVHTKITPPDLTVALIAAQIALANMGDDDLGQAMVLQDGVVIAREDARGTAAMLQDLGAPATGAILFKAPKPKQILQADMPLIGPDTAIQSADAGLMGIVIPHGGVMVLDLPQVIATLDAQGMFLWVAP